MWVYKISFFILCYFFARIAVSACEPHTNAKMNLSLCWDEKSHAWISEKCLTSECDAAKFLSQYRSRKSALKASISPLKACEELQVPVLHLKNSKGISVPFCLFNDGSVLDATVVEKLVL